MIAKFSSFSKESRLKDIAEAVKFCSLCPRMHQRSKILSEANGSLNSKILFVGEAPGRLGADRTGVPFLGDKTGSNFESLLGTIGWKRENLFITNSVLCNPRSESGNNAKPTHEEIRNCSCYLLMTINLIQPQVVVSLGTTALEALTFICPHYVNLKNNVATAIEWYDRILLPLYHPGPRALVHRSFAKQTSDFFRLSKLVHPVKGILVRKISKENKQRTALVSSSVTPLHQVVYAILQSLKESSYFKLSKLLYLIDLCGLERLGSTITGEVYLRQQEGPWIPRLKQAVKEMNKHEVYLFYRGRVPFTRLGRMPRIAITLKNEELEVIVEILEKYGHLTNSAIKTVTYRTKPMQYILNQERLGKKMLNKAIIYKDKTILEKG